MIVAICGSKIPGISCTVTIPFNNSVVTLQLVEGQSLSINISLGYHLFDPFVTLTTRCWSDYPKVAILTNWTDYRMSSIMFDNSTVMVTVPIFAKRLGGSTLYCEIKNANSTKIEQHKVAILIVKRTPTIIELIFRIILIFLIVIITFVMGAEIDPKIVFQYLKRPSSPFIGFICQFIFMPLTAFALAKVSNINNAFGLGLLTIGCSPGGGASNIWTVLFGGDLNLSMTMTFISSCAALFMMPFWLFVLGRFFIDPYTLSIPYGQIGMDLLQVVVPVGFGMLCRWKFEKQMMVLTKKVKILGLLYLIYVLTFGTYANLYLMKLMGDYHYLLLLGASLPWIGFLLGYVISLITRQTKGQAIAIALETGIQNIGIALLIQKFSMPQPMGDLGAVMPLIVGLSTPFPLYIAITIFAIKKKCCNKKQLEDHKLNTISTEQKDILLDRNGV